MRRSTASRSLLVLAVLGLPVLSRAVDRAEPTDPSLATTVAEKHGYWWYENPPAPATDPETEQPVHPDLPPPPGEAQLLALHPDAVETLVNDYRRYALWKLTPEHVQWYFALQDFVRRRSTAFMNVTQYVMLTHPALNMKTESPDTSPGVAAKEATYRAAIDQRLDAEREHAALILFTRASCPYCKAQHNALLYFAQRHGWEVREIDVDRHPDVRARFSADYTPTTVVIVRGSEQWFPVSVGVDTVSGIEESTYRALRVMRGETQAQTYTLPDYQQGGILDPNGIPR